MSARVEHADMLQAIPRLVAEGLVVDAVVTDPPYHLVAAAQRSNYAMRDGPHKRTIAGFMGQQWDGGDIAFRPETWATVASIMRPGAFLVAFGGARTHHRVWSAIEDAGFVIQDTIMWLFATGFPKRRDHLKPAYEPICLAYKPGGKRSMQIDECRIEGGDNTTKAWRGAGDRDREQYRTGTTGATIPTDLGRWPANICHSGEDEVLAAFPQSAGQQGDVRGTEPSATGDNGIYGHFDRVSFNKRVGEASAERRYTNAGVSDFAMLPGTRRSDAGSAARFFFSAKASAQDRWGSRHPTVKPVELMKWLVALVCPPGGTVLDPFAGSGTTGAAALATGRNAILIEREAAYVADIRERMAHYEGEGRHSLASKARRAVDKPLGGLFAPAYDAALDSRLSYDEAVRAIGERVKAGEPVPEFFLSQKGRPHDPG